jgi:peptidoglycan/xylan/chitin deacetylase (PgdA/CDA1 family)
LFLGSKNICSHFYLNTTCVSEDKSKIHLTFDDGPHPEITPKILDILKQHNQKATFFCIGHSIEKYPDIFQNIINQGHEIGNHSYSHSVFFDFFRTDRILNEIEKTNRLIMYYSNIKYIKFRPPFGITNPNLAKALKKSGMEAIGWSIRSLDTLKTGKKVLKRLQNVKAGDIILFHDTKKNTPEILDEFLRSLRNQK